MRWWSDADQILNMWSFTSLFHSYPRFKKEAKLNVTSCNLGHILHQICVGSLFGPWCWFPLQPPPIRVGLTLFLGWRYGSERARRAWPGIKWVSLAVCIQNCKGSQVAIAPWPVRRCPQYNVGSGVSQGCLAIFYLAKCGCILMRFR